MRDRAERFGTAGLALVLAAAGWQEARAADVGRLNSLLDRIASNPNDGGVMNDIENICLQAGRPGAEAERAGVSVAILSRLGPNTPVDARAMLLKQLERIGRAEVVAGLSQLLMDQDARVREGARRALQGNPSPQAGKALQKALEKAKDAEWRAALVNAIGGRGDGDTVEDLVKLLDERDKNDEEVAIAAAAALGRMGGADAAKALSSAMTKGSPAFRAAATDAYLSCADIFLAEGDYTEATEIYKKLYSAQGSNLLKIAGMQGLAAVQAAKASGKKEVRSKPASTKEKPASAAPKKPTVAPEVAAEWDAKLRARLEESVKAGKKPSFQLASMRTKVQVIEVADGGEIKVSARGMQLGVPMSRLTATDKKNLAAAMAGDDPAGNAVAAFYCLALGDKAAAGAHLRKAGAGAGEVSKLFE